jgi:hypothetical protein
MLVRAVFAPECGKDAELGEGGRPAQHRPYAPVLFLTQIVLANQLVGYRGIALKGLRVLERHAGFGVLP